MRFSLPICLSLLLFLSVALAPSGWADETSKSTLANIVDKATKYLAEKGQAEDGTFSKEAGPGVTALVLTATLRHGKDLKDPMVAKGMKAMEGL